MRKSAIVTIISGKDYAERWNRWCRPGWVEYARRHKLDIVTLKHELDSSDRAAARSMSWQKLLILSQDFSRKYERIVWLDADIVANPLAPSIVEATPPDKIGAVLEGAYILDDLKCILLKRMYGSCPEGPSRKVWQDAQRSMYLPYGFKQQPPEVVQAGVLVLNPRLHAPLLEQVYQAPYPEGRSYEQIPLSYAILSERLLHPLDSRFNTVFVERMLVQYPYLTNELTRKQLVSLTRLAVSTELANSFFLHFARARVPGLSMMLQLAAECCRDAVRREQQTS